MKIAIVAVAVCAAFVALAGAALYVALREQL